jgi:hypothetical protein
MNANVRFRRPRRHLPGLAWTDSHPPIHERRVHPTYGLDVLRGGSVANSKIRYLST